MKSRVQIALLVAGMILAFATGRTLAAECSYHSPTCTYRVGGCYQTEGTCLEHGGGYCWIEYGTCCGGAPGSDYTKFCAPSCDGSGGGPPCSD
jgi:hypothetical protein